MSRSRVHAPVRPALRAPTRSCAVRSVHPHARGYVGNKAAVFPLQLLGFDVDPINSVQLSNHTGYPTWKGQILDGEQLWALIEGLEANGLLFYTHLLTGGFQKYPHDLARAAELAVASLQVVLARTLQHRSPPLDGTESSPTPPTPKRLELCLVQSRDDIISPPVVLRAQAVESGVDGLDGLQDGESALRVTRTVLVSRRVAMEDAEARRSRLRSMRESAAKQQAASPGAPTPSAALSALPSPDFSPPLIRTHLRVRHPGKADLGR
ncbi:unnamed protein product [Closterium sp. NIES-65]|nr:unnamed protein product [Closterium sp. NIES-65]